MYKSKSLIYRGLKTSIRITMLFFLLLAALKLSAQEQKVILSVRETTVKQFFDEVQRQTEYNLAIDWNSLDPKRRVLVSSNALSVTDLFKELLTGTGYTFRVNGNHIIITPAAPGEQFPPSIPDKKVDRSGILNNNIQSPTMFSPDAIKEIKEIADPYTTTKSSIKKGYWEAKRDSTGAAKMVMIYFRVNSTLLERDFMDNAKALKVLDDAFSDMQSIVDMDYATINAAASPEGDAENNEKLAMNRALAIKSYIMWKHPHINREGIITFSVGEDWSGLRKMVEDDLSVPARDEVLTILNMSINSEDKKMLLTRLNEGKSYTYIKTNMLPYLRGGAACMIFYKSKGQGHEQEVILPTVVTKIDTVYLKERVPVLDTMCVETTEVVERDTVPNKFYMALKTNILYDALLLPNLAVEFYIPGRWSIEVEGDWSWWNTGSKEKYWRIQSAGIELRKWMGKKYKNRPLNGHYLGLYGMAGTYDVKLEERGYLSDWSYSVGLSYGYSLPIAKRLNLEFGLALGYLGGEYKDYHYDSYDSHFPWERTRQRHYFGPTKAKAALVWLIGSGVNQKKNNKKVSNQ